MVSRLPAMVRVECGVVCGDEAAGCTLAHNRL